MWYNKHFDFATDLRESSHFRSLSMVQLAEQQQSRPHGIEQHYNYLGSPIPTKTTIHLKYN